MITSFNQYHKMNENNYEREAQVTQDMGGMYRVEIWNHSQWSPFSRHRFRADANKIKDMYLNGSLLDEIIWTIEDLSKQGLSVLLWKGGSFHNENRKMNENKYAHTAQDSETDMAEIAKFTDAFESKFMSVLQLEQGESHNKPMDYLGHGAESVYHSATHNIHTNNIRTNRSAFCFIHTDINPNGVKTGNDHTRTYVISFELKGETRRKYAKNWNEDTLIKYYNYAMSIEEAIENFEYWVNTQYQSFMRNHK